jgi:hypothetical protein
MLGLVPLTTTRWLLYFIKYNLYGTMLIDIKTLINLCTDIITFMY